MIPKTNMIVVMPNMNILGVDEVKPGLDLKAIVLSACAVLSFESTKSASQEDVNGDNVEHDIDACGAEDHDSETGIAIAELVDSLTIYDADKKIVVNCQFVLIVIVGSTGSIAGHDGGTKWRTRPDQNLKAKYGAANKAHRPLRGFLRYFVVAAVRERGAECGACIAPYYKRGIT